MPAAAAAGLPLDAQTTHAWSVSVFIEMCRDKAHYKLPKEFLKPETIVSVRKFHEKTNDLNSLSPAKPSIAIADIYTII